MTELEATTGVVAEPTNFWTYFFRFAILVLWFLTGLAFIFTLTPYRLLPDVFLSTFVILWIRKPRLRKARMLAIAFTAFLLVEAYFHLTSAWFIGQGSLA